jgi:hypothetical protein
VGEPGGPRAPGVGEPGGRRVAGVDEERAAVVASTTEGLRATAGWAVPLQWVAILGSGGIAAFLALTHRWQPLDWLFVLLCALYVANAVGFRRLSGRSGR